MASTRKVRTLNKRFNKSVEDSPDKDEASPNKSKNRKRKLSDMLGSQWSKEELERFYEAFRKYGKDWRKVSGAIRNRSSEMVEALYNMNKAYLSLPEGTATAEGLIAMMTDHYNILEGSDSDRESNDVSRTSRKPQKRGRGKFRAMSKVSDGLISNQLQNQSALARYGCLSLLKKNTGDIFAGNRPRAVGKRTPRVPVSNIYIKDDRDIITKQHSRSLVLADDEGAHVAALALAEVLQRGGSPQVSRTSRRRVDQIGCSPIKNTEVKIAEPGIEGSRLIVGGTDGDCQEVSLGSREAENGDFARDDNDGFGTVGAKKKVRKRQGKRPRTIETEHLQLDDDREACSGTEEGSSVRKMKEEIDIDARDDKTTRGSKSSRKRSRQLFFGDENSALDALQTLADLSVNLLPSSAVESESSAHVKEEKGNVDIDDKPNIPESSPLYKHGNNSDVMSKKETRPSTNVADTVTGRSPKAVKNLHLDTNAILEMNQQACACTTKIEKRKGKPNAKASKSELVNDSHKGESKKTEIFGEEGKKSINKVKRGGQASPLPKQGKSQKAQESSCIDPGKPLTDLSEVTVQALTQNQVNSFVKSINRRKIGLQKVLALKEQKTNEKGDDRADRHSCPNIWMPELNEKLSHCLSSKLLRRWCKFEWFYSAIDYPWFAKSEFVEYLNHVRLGHIPRLTRVEWGVIRSSLGKPRRLSKQFLLEEREKLEQYRESVRMHYSELRAGLREGLPTDLARPLSVGQRVIACHPKTREIHNGSVLTVDRNRCRVQFDRPELGVEFVLDIDCMPLNPLENIPEALRAHNIGLNRYCNNFSTANFVDRANGWIRTSMKDSLKDSFDIAERNFRISASSYPMHALMKQAKGDTIDAIIQAKATVNEVTVAAQQAMYSQPCTLSQIQETEADIRALAELSRALDKKEALLVELRHMNEEVSGTQKDSDTIKDLENFRKQYATVLVQLRDANDQVASALLSLRQRNTYQENATHPLVRSSEVSAGTAGLPEYLNPSPFVNQDSGSRVVEIVETSRQKARTMVDAALQAICTLNEGESDSNKVPEASGLVNSHDNDAVSILGSRATAILGQTISENPDQATSGTIELAALHPFRPKSSNLCDAESQLSAELISACVSTLLMIQTCTERHYPPAEIAQILDSAVLSLQPCCQQNLQIYSDIETCMGIIKNQILALIPTQSTITSETISV